MFYWGYLNEKMNKVSVKSQCGAPSQQHIFTDYLHLHQLFTSPNIPTSKLNIFGSWAVCEIKTI